jgi:cation transport protein ChaC
MMQDGGDLWVFGYGSLMWRPGFVFAERCGALVEGWHRSLCIYSHVHRGTPAHPGLVLGLDQGGMCHGVAFRIGPESREATIAYLRERELVTNVYLEQVLPLQLEDGRAVSGLAYVVDRTHAQYAGRLARPELLQLVLQGRGMSGTNPDYVRATHEHLAEQGIPDETLTWIAAHLDDSD